MSKTNLMYTPEIKASQKRSKMRRKELKRRSRSVHQKHMILDPSSLITVAACCVVFAVMCCIMVFGIEIMYSQAVQELRGEIIALEQKNHELVLANTQLTTDRDSALLVLQEVSNIAVELDTSNGELLALVDDLNATIETYESREELFDKYEWAIIQDKNNNRTDITYENIVMLQDLTEEKGMSEDVVDLVLALAMTEARGNETAKNSTSTASGYGQFLYSTGKYVYEDLMGNGKGTYKHEYALDGETNLQMITYYLEDLGDTYKNNIDLVMDNYRGDTDRSYNRKLDSYLAKAGTSLHSIVIKP